MKSIKFSEKEIEFLREQYTEELANAELYVEQIKEILNKLGVSVKVKPVEKENKKEKKEAQAQPGKNKEPKKRGRKPKEVKPAEPKKRGRKPKVVIPAAEPELPALPVKTEVSKPVKQDKKPKTVKVTVKTTSSKAAVAVKKEIKPAPKKKAGNHTPKGKKKVANTPKPAKKVEPAPATGDTAPAVEPAISTTQE